MDSKVDMGLGTTVEPCKWCGYCPEAEERSCSCCRTLRQAAIEAKVKNLRAWLADPKFPVKTERVYHPFGWATVEFLDLDGIFPTGEVSIGVGVIREVWGNICKLEDILAVSFKENPSWYSKFAYREKPLVVARSRARVAVRQEQTPESPKGRDSGDEPIQ